MPMTSRQCIKILPPDKKHNQPRRCGGMTTQEDLEWAQQLLSMVPAYEGDERTNIIQRMILLRICKNTHRWTLEDVSQRSTLANLATIYEKNLVMTGIVRSAGNRQDELFEPFYRHQSQNIGDILSQDINAKQHATGSVYVFEWPRAPGLLKIGFAKESAGDRISIWQHCHSEAKLIYAMDFAFPERMEKLIHLALAEKRRCLRVQCPRCGRKHAEWFETTLEEAKRVINGWHEIAGSPLYTPERTLSREWSVALQSLSQITMATMSRCLKEMSSGDARSTNRDVEDARTALPRPLVGMKNIDSFSPIALQSGKNFGVDQLAADLARTTIVSPTLRERINHNSNPIYVNDSGPTSQLATSSKSEE
ncbi:hypothetical protein H2200_007905 [Cladophialophora chaetospira]|uniref:Bacteriophage T5 Orf172 DNA-binding domain-containing protein n=1 Tax=Cladophialophora chaetospira TaxID=386627 RepID=A0AA39CGI6_9EURO|nr:hypothetical protein H2200_007905 [Cladophialophora chaetospira]